MFRRKVIPGDWKRRLRFQCKAFKALKVQSDNPCNSPNTQYPKLLLLQH